MKITKTPNNQEQNSELESPSNLTANLAPDTTSQINTNFMEQRIVDEQVAYPSTQIQLPSSVEAEMADGSWMAKQQLMKPVQLGQYTWSSTNARSSDIASFRFPQVLETVESLTLRTLRMYAFYKLAPCFRIQINATQFHQGQLICSFDPFSISEPYAAGVDDAFTAVYATGLPHVKIMASESDAVELKIPFIHPRSFLTTNSGVFNNLGTFRVTVLNPLLSAEGASPNVTVTVWTYAIDSEVHVPIQDHAPILEPTSGKVKQSGKIKQNQRSQPQPESPQAPSLMENLSKGLSQTKNMFGNFITGNFGQALRWGQGLIDTAGSIFNFDYPSEVVSPQKCIMPVENMAVGRGKSRSQRLAIDPYSMHMLEDDIASESSRAMNLKEILQIPMITSQFKFESTSPQDSLLFSIPVHPQMSPLVVGPDALGMQRSYLSFVSNAFNYWSGGICYDIEVVATRFHSGKLIFAYVPNDAAEPTYAAACASLPNVIVDIQQTSNTTFIVPFTSSTAMKSTVLPLEIDDPNQFTDAATGTLVCFVQNVLNYASNVSPSIEINVYSYGHSDFNLYVPRKPVWNQPQTSFLETTSGISIVSNGTSSNPTTSTLSKDQSDMVARKHFGENYSLQDLIKRFSFRYNVTMGKPQDKSYSNYEIEYITPFPATIPSNVGVTFSYLSYFSFIYSAWTGSIRWKMVTTDNRFSTRAFEVSHQPDSQIASIVNDGPISAGVLLPYTNVGFGLCRTNLAQDNSIEVETPYYSKYNMLLTRTPLLPTDSDYVTNGNLFYYFTDYVNSATATSLDVDVYQAAGEDFRFIYLRPPPLDFSFPLIQTSEILYS